MSICMGSGMGSSISTSSGAGACSSGYIKGLMYFSGDGAGAFSSGYIKGSMYFSGDGHEDEYE